MVRDPSDPKVWVQFAESDLAFANVKRTAKMMIEKQLFHAQQCAENAIKAVMVWHRCAP